MNEYESTINRLLEENSLYRARILELERRDTTPAEPPTSRNGYALLSEQVRELTITVDKLSAAVSGIVGRLDVVAADAATAARVATEIHRSYTEAKPTRDRVDSLETKLVSLEKWRSEFKSRHCGACILGGSDDPGPLEAA